MFTPSVGAASGYRVPVQRVRPTPQRQQSPPPVTHDRQSQAMPTTHDRQQSPPTTQPASHVMTTQVPSSFNFGDVTQAVKGGGDGKLGQSTMHGGHQGQVPLSGRMYHDSYNVSEYPLRMPDTHNGNDRNMGSGPGSNGHSSDSKANYDSSLDNSGQTEDYRGMRLPVARPRMTPSVDRGLHSYQYYYNRDINSSNTQYYNVPSDSGTNQYRASQWGHRPPTSSTVTSINTPTYLHQQGATLPYQGVWHSGGLHPSRLIQEIMTNSPSSAFRTHPLFPLLRDVIIADMNFSNGSYPQTLMASLPDTYEKLVHGFQSRNHVLGVGAISSPNPLVEQVVVDALKYAHQCLLGKSLLHKSIIGVSLVIICSFHYFI